MVKRRQFVAPSQPFGELSPDGVAIAPLSLQKIDHAVEPNGNGTFEQALLYALQAMLCVPKTSSVLVE